MKVSEILKPSLAAQLEGKVNLALKEHQKENLKEKEQTKIENLSENKAQRKIDLLV